MTVVTFPSDSAVGLAPRYHQVRVSLSRRIEAGEWRPGDQIPSEPELMRQFGVSRGTLRQALDVLVRHGVLERQQGRGTFVGRPPVAAAVTDFFHFVEDLRQRGFRIDFRLIERAVIPADDAVAGHLALEPGAPVVAIRRLLLLDGVPFRLDDYFLPHARFAGLMDEDLVHNYIYTLLQERYGVRLTKQQKWIEPVVLCDDEAVLLEIPQGGPALLIESLGYGTEAGAPDPNGNARDATPVEFRRMHMRGDKCRLFLQVEPGTQP